MLLAGAMGALGRCSGARNKGDAPTFKGLVAVQARKMQEDRGAAACSLGGVAHLLRQRSRAEVSGGVLKWAVARAGRAGAGSPGARRRTEARLVSVLRDAGVERQRRYGRRAARTREMCGSDRRPPPFRQFALKALFVRWRGSATPDRALPWEPFASRSPAALAASFRIATSPHSSLPEFGTHGR